MSSSKLPLYLLGVVAVIAGVLFFTTKPNDVQKVEATPVVVRNYPSYTDNTMTIENEMALINSERYSAGLQYLSENEKLDTSACSKLTDMVQYQYWDHISPSGVTPWHWFNVAGYSYTHAGENLAYGQVNAQELINQWVNSPKHKANILNKDYTEQGMCMQQVQFLGQKTWLIVSHFGSQE